MTTQTEAQRLEAEVQALRGAVPAVPDWSKMYAAPAAPQPAAQQEPAPGRCKLCNGSGVGNSGVHSLCICQYGGAAPQPAAQQEPAYTEAVSLATALFKKHFAHEEHYASGRIVWGPCDTTAGVISQIDNMVSGLIQPTTQQAPAGEPVAVFREDDDIGHIDLLPYQGPMLKDGDKLYTRPAVPLTDEFLLSLWSGSDSPRPVLGKNKVLAFARAIEAAHKIGGAE